MYPGADPYSSSEIVRSMQRMLDARRQSPTAVAPTAPTAAAPPPSVTAAPATKLDPGIADWLHSQFGLGQGAPKPEAAPEPALKFGWGGNAPQAVGPDTDIHDLPGAPGAPQGWMPGGRVDAAGHSLPGIPGGTGGLLESQTDWSKVANPMAFDAYREGPARAELEALTKDPLFRERGTAGIQEAATGRLMQQQSDIAGGVQEEIVKRAVAAAKRGAVVGLARDPAYLTAPPAVRERMEAEAQAEAESRIRSDMFSGRSTYNVVPTMPRIG